MILVSILCAVMDCTPTNPPLNIDNLSTLAFSNFRERDSETSPDPLIVYTDKGFIEGSFERTLDGRKIASFQSIPYGKAPIGERRFRAPVPVDPWSGILPAKSLAPSCLQLDFSRLFRVHGKEDCLYLNVFSPKIQNDEPLPVLVFFHGGGYMCGSSNMYGPAYFLNRDIVLVTINYRLGPLGFLSTGDAEASGNWGMKDAILALKWVQTNIKSFGGDASRVTVMGESTGAATAGLLVVSPMADGLFHRAICQSGSALGHFAVINDTVPNSKILAKGFGCPTHDSRVMMKCLRQKDPNWIVARSINFLKELLITLNFGPVIEHRGFVGDGDEPFLVEAPEVSYAQGRAKRVPMILGFNQDEGAFFAGIYYLIPFTLSKLNSRWNELAPYALAYISRTNHSNEVSRQVREFYMNNEALTFWNRQGWIRALGDRIITQSVYYGMQHHSLIAPTYGYVFSYAKEMSIFNTMGLKGKDWGVGHVDELMYMFNNSQFDPVSRRSQEDYGMSSFLTTVWSNFAATGKPNYTNNNGTDAAVELWKPITNWSKIEVLNIGRKVEMIPMPFMDRMDFWTKLRLKDDHPIITS